jgi:hypothetical protein
MTPSQQINKNLSSLVFEIQERDLREKSAEEYADRNVKELEELESADDNSVIL